MTSVKHKTYTTIPLATGVAPDPVSALTLYVPPPPPERRLYQKDINQKISETINENFDKAGKVSRLKQAATIGAPPVEQYHYAGISKATYYRWMDADPELRDELETLENAALRIKARRNMAKRIEAEETSANIGVSLEYLRRTDDKMRTTKIEHGGAVSNLNLNVEIPLEDQEAIKKFDEMLLANMRKRNLERARQQGFTNAS